MRRVEKTDNKTGMRCEISRSKHTKTNNKLDAGSLSMKSTILFAALITLFTTAKAQEVPLFAKLQIEMVSENMSDVNPNFGLVSQANIRIDENSIELALTKRMPDCPMGRYCPQIMPSSFSVNLTLVDVIQTECSTKYVGITPIDDENPLHEQVVVEDFTNTTCESTFRSSGIITYTVTGISATSQQKETAGARFTVHGGFVKPVVNP